MTHWTRSWTVAAASALAIAAIPGVIVTIRPAGSLSRRLRQRRATGPGEWLREHRRRGRPLCSAAGVLRPDALRSTAAAERLRMRELQRQMGQRRRVQLSPSRPGSLSIGGTTISI